MTNELRRLLDRHSGGALEAMNNLCRAHGLEGYITATPEGKDGLFTFSAYKDGATRFFATARVPGAAYLVEDVQTSETVRLLKKAAARTKGRITKAATVWNLALPGPPGVHEPQGHDEHVELFRRKAGAFDRFPPGRFRRRLGARRGVPIPPPATHVAEGDLQWGL